MIRRVARQPQGNEETLGGHVDVGAGAGANAVVLIDVPAGKTAAGVPARIIAPDAGAPA